MTNGHIKASILFGQRLIRGEKTDSQNVFEEASLKYKLNDEQVKNLLCLFHKTPRVDLNFFDADLQNTVEYFYEQIKVIFEHHEDFNKLYEDFRVRTQNIAHEFLLPVQSIAANCDVLESKIRTVDIEADLREVPSDILMEMECLCLTADNLLSFFESKTDYNLKTEQIDMMNLLHRCKDLFNRFAQKHRVKIFIEDPYRRIGHFNPLVEAEYDPLLRVFKNLFHNGIKYSLGSQRYLRISVDGFVDSLRVTIGNFGYGIKESECLKIYEEGYRGELVRDLHRTGSGIGLSEVKRILDRHKATINVTSTDQKSGYLTVFTVKLLRKIL